jgi:hypothetical protein
MIFGHSTKKGVPALHRKTPSAALKLRTTVREHAVWRGTSLGIGKKHDKTDLLFEKRGKKIFLPINSYCSVFKENFIFNFIIFSLRMYKARQSFYA